MSGFRTLNLDVCYKCKQLISGFVLHQKMYLGGKGLYHGNKLSE